MWIASRMEGNEGMVGQPGMKRWHVVGRRGMAR